MSDCSVHCEACVCLYQCVAVAVMALFVKGVAMVRYVRQHLKREAKFSNTISFYTCNYELRPHVCMLPVHAGVPCA